MLRLWSRAARNPVSCRCIQCSSNTTPVQRWPGRVEIKARGIVWTPTWNYAYTTTRSAAGDGRTEAEKEELSDAVYSLLRQELANPDNDRVTPVEVSRVEDVLVDEASFSFHNHCIPLDQVWPNGVDWDRIYRLVGTELTENHVYDKRLSTAPPVLSPDDEWELISVDSRFPDTQVLRWHANTGRDLIRHHLPPQSLWSFDHIRDKALRRRHTWKKLAIQELSIAMLVFSLMGPARDLALSKDDLIQLAPALRPILLFGHIEIAQLRHAMLDDIGRIERTPDDISESERSDIKAQTEKHTKPHYFQDNDGDFYHICQQMNAAIKEIFSKRTIKWSHEYPWPRELATQMARIAHNLLVSSSAPDVQTFNMLLTGFKRWHLPNIVDEVIVALDKCKIRPNEITCAIILDHYIQTNRPDKFIRYVESMRGYKNALMMAHPDTNINEAGASRLIRVNEKKVYQKIHPTPLVFNAMMLGVLRFAGIERAMEIYFEMNEDGWGLDVLGLTHFLVDCVRRSDWHNGLYVWEEIDSIKRKADRKHMAKAYANMLSLCTVTGNTTAFNHVLKDVTNLGFSKKEILHAAMSITQTLHNQQKQKLAAEAIDAPPITADKVLIAVSEYMKEEEKEKPAPTVDFHQNLPLGEANLPIPEIKPEPLPAKDPDVAWAAWVQHELGLQSQSRHSVPAPKPNPKPAAAKDPNVEWAAWVEHELSLQAKGRQTVEKAIPKIRPAPPAKDPDAAWAAWVEHELSLQSKARQGTEKANSTVKPAPPAKNPDEAWAAWVEHELGLASGKVPVAPTNNEPSKTQEPPVRVTSSRDELSTSPASPKAPPSNSNGKKSVDRRKTNDVIPTRENGAKGVPPKENGVKGVPPKQGWRLFR